MTTHSIAEHSTTPLGSCFSVSHKRNTDTKDQPFIIDIQFLLSLDLECSNPAGNLPSTFLLFFSAAKSPPLTLNRLRG